VFFVRTAFRLALTEEWEDDVLLLPCPRYISVEHYQFFANG
jgi:hypothetical protein